MEKQIIVSSKKICNEKAIFPLYHIDIRYKFKKKIIHTIVNEETVKELVYNRTYKCENLKHLIILWIECDVVAQAIVYFCCHTKFKINSDLQLAWYPFDIYIFISFCDNNNNLK